MIDYFRGKTLTCEQTKPRTYFTPVFQRIGDRLKLHHMEVDCLGYRQPKKMLPIEHMGKHKRRIFELEDENAKLRELCAGLWSVMWACAEQRCPHRHEDCFVVNGNGDDPKGHGECWYKIRMRELGIEVLE